MIKRAGLYFLLCLGCIALFSSCRKEAVQIENFSAQAWANDAQGCQGQRLGQVPTLQSSFEQLKGLNQQAVVALLGQPDKHELYRRNQKFFFYFVGPGKHCPDSAQAPVQAAQIRIRFDAIGRLNELVVLNR